jgi:hypothetical protein
MEVRQSGGESHGGWQARTSEMIMSVLYNGEPSGVSGRVSEDGFLTNANAFDEIHSQHTTDTKTKQEKCESEAQKCHPPHC